MEEGEWLLKNIVESTLRYDNSSLNKNLIDAR